MYQKTARIFFLGMFLFSFFSPLPADGAGLVPCGQNVNDPATDIDESAKCTMCHLVVAGNGIINWLMGIMTILAIAIVFAMAIYYIISAGNQGMMETAKSGIKAALIGFAVMLSAWLIVNTTLRIFGATIPGLTSSSGGFTFTCDISSSAGTSSAGAGAGVGAGAPAGGGAACENIDAARARLSAGGTVCNGSGSCPSCNTQPFDSLIERYAKQYKVSPGLIRGVIARESSCDRIKEKKESDGSSSCGLMQVNTRSSTYSCAQLKDSATGIMEGTRILAAAYSTAQSLKAKYGNRVTVNELAAAIHNAGAGESAASVDCSSASGWPTIPKWGCPINPGNAQFNACAIRDYACNVGACK